MREWPSLIGRKFGRLEVKNQVKSKRFECPSGAAVSRYWSCLCICGNYREVSTANLTSGEVQSCGCLCPSSHRKRPFESIYNRLVYAAKNRQIFLDLTYEDFLCFTKILACVYCETPIHWNIGEKGNVRTNLDRKDNALGYTKDNCVVCCGTCNRVKGNLFTYEEFIVMMKALVKFRRGRKWSPIQKKNHSLRMKIWHTQRGDNDRGD